MTVRTPTLAGLLRAWCVLDTWKGARMLVRYFYSVTWIVFETLMRWDDEQTLLSSYTSSPLLRGTLVALWCVMGSCRESSLGAWAVLSPTFQVSTPKSALWFPGSMTLFPDTARLSSLELHERRENREIEIEGDRERRWLWVVSERKAAG